MAALPELHLQEGDDQVHDRVTYSFAPGLREPVPEGCIPLHQLCKNCFRFFDKWEVLDRFIVKPPSLPFERYGESIVEIHFCTYAQLLEGKRSCQSCIMVFSELERKKASRSPHGPGEREELEYAPQRKIVFRVEELWPWETLIGIEPAAEGETWLSWDAPMALKRYSGEFKHRNCVGTGLMNYSPRKPSVPAGHGTVRANLCCRQSRSCYSMDRQVSLGSYDMRPEHRRRTATNADS